MNKYYFQIKPGDLIAYSGKRLLDKVIQWVTGSQYAHVAIVLEVERVDDSKIRVLIAESAMAIGLPDFQNRECIKGVQIHDLAKYIEAYSSIGEMWWIPLKKELSNDGLVNMQTWLKEANAQRITFAYWKMFLSWLYKFDIWKLLPQIDAPTLFCSELVTKALQIASAVDLSIHPSEQTPHTTVNLACFQDQKPVLLNTSTKRRSYQINSYLNNIGFSWLHRNHLIYVTCWEDPLLDQVAMTLQDSDTVVAISSAGCNVLSYALSSPKHVYAIDMNPRQIALLELKMAGIRELEFPVFFELFGQGRLANFEIIYREKLRKWLSPWSQHYWDANGKRFFDGRRSFYFRGTTGTFARLINYYIDNVVKLGKAFDALIDAKTIEQQQKIYEREIYPTFWTKSLRKVLNRNLVLWMLGVPYSQREQLEFYHQGSIANFIEQRCHTVACEIPMQDNYFWRVFRKGEYSVDCCPDYLKYGNFQALKAGLVDRISVHTSTVTEFLNQCEDTISRFVLLDHMDWLSCYYLSQLKEEWQAIINRASTNSRVIFRSSGLKVEYLDAISVAIEENDYKLKDILTYNELANKLHQKDRVNTYGSFYIADLNKNLDK